MKELDEIKNQFNIHLRDYEDVRQDVDKIQAWIDWGLKIVLGAVILAILAIVGLGR